MGLFEAGLRRARIDGGLLKKVFAGIRHSAQSEAEPQNLPLSTLASPTAPRPIMWSGKSRERCHKLKRLQPEASETGIGNDGKATLRSTAQNINSTWTKSGHVLQATPGPAVFDPGIQAAPIGILWPYCADDVKCAPRHRVFSGDRTNDHHPALAEIRAAREAGRSSS